MDNATRTDRLLEAFAHLHHLFTRTNTDLFIHLRRHTRGATSLRFHCQWPPPHHLAEELDAMACELNIAFRPEYVEGVGHVITLEPVPELEDLGAMPSNIRLEP